MQYLTDEYTLYSSEETNLPVAFFLFPHLPGDVLRVYPIFLVHEDGCLAIPVLAAVPPFVVERAGQLFVCNLTMRPPF